LVVDAGFRDIDVRVSTVPMRLGAAQTEILGYLSALPIGSEVAAMEETARTAMLQDIMTALIPFGDQETFVIPTASHVVLARK
jgi:hypothetical protein